MRSSSLTEPCIHKAVSSCAAAVVSNRDRAADFVFQQLMEPTATGGPLWDGEKRFWHAHSETATQIFTDTLYGQVRLKQCLSSLRQQHRKERRPFWF